MSVLANGVIVEGHRIDGVIGHGGMGVVYEATDLFFDRTVALKLIGAQFSQDAAYRERFRREGVIQAGISHPHIVTVYKGGESEYGLFIAMQLVRGPNMKDLIAAGELDERRTLRLLSQVADALDTAHEAGLIHRDIKPNNILVDVKRDCAYLADFGITKARDMSQLTGTGQLVGTPDYISPEQILGRGATERSDVYALGVVLFECLTASVPFPRDSDIAVIYAHLSDTVPPVTETRSDLPSTLDEVVRKAMAKEPEDRFASASELMSEAERALGPLLIVAPGPAPVAPTETPTAVDGGPQPVETLVPGAETTAGATRSEATAIRVEPDTDVRDAEDIGTLAAKPPELTAVTPIETPEAPPEAPAAEEPEAPPAERPKVEEPEPPPAAPPEPELPEAPPAEPPVLEVVEPPPAAPTERQLEPVSASAEPAADQDALDRARDAAKAPSVPAPPPVVPTALSPPVPPPPTSVAAGGVAAPLTPPPSPPTAVARPEYVQPRDVTTDATGVVVARPAERRRGGAGKIAAIAAVLVAVIAAGAVAGRASSGDEEATSPPPAQGPSAVQSGNVALTKPGDWRRREQNGKIPGLSLAQPIGLAPAGSEGSGGLVAGRVTPEWPTFLPAEFRKRLGSDVVNRAETVRIGKHEGLRYRQLEPTGFDGRVTVYVVPQADDATLIACFAKNPAATKLLADCEQIAGTVSVSGANPYPIGPTRQYATTLNRTIQQLENSRKQSLQQIRSADTQAAQSRAASRLTSTCGASLKRLRAAEPTAFEQPAHERIVTSLSQTCSAYNRLARAARPPGNRGRWATARKSVTVSEAQLQARIESLRQIGFRL